MHLLNPGAVIRPDLKGLEDTKDLHPFLEPADAYGNLTGRTNDSTDTRDGRVECMAYALIHQERGLYSARGVRAETVWRDWAVEQRIEETDILKAARA